MLIVKRMEGRSEMMVEELYHPPAREGTEDGFFQFLQAACLFVC